MDVNNLVSNMVSADFSDADIIDAVEVAYYYCSAIFGEDITVDSGTVGTNAITISDNQQGMAIALLAQATIIEGRRILSMRGNSDITVRSTDELFTEEMRNMLLIADATDDAEVNEDIMWSNLLPTERWEIF